MTLLPFLSTSRLYDPFQRNASISLSNKILYLLFQIIALVRVMPMISMEAAIFVFIVLIGIFLHLLWPLQGGVILDLHNYLIKWSIQGCVVLTSSWRRTRLPVVSILLFSCPDLLWTMTLFKMVWEICFHLLSFLLFLGNDCIFYIHKALCWMDEFSHSLRL